MAAGLLVLAGLSVLSSSSTRSARPVGAAVRGPAALQRLGSLPVQAQSVISGVLGAERKSFAVRRVGGSYHLGGGGVSADAGPRRLMVRAGGGSVSMALAGMGRGGRVEAVSGSKLRASGNRVMYTHPGVSEWYAAGPLGVEQGFSVARRPKGAGGSLTLSLAVGGSLRAQQAGPQVRLVDSAGRVRLRYGGLAAIDASGRHLPASLTVAGASLLLRVVDAHARYPVRIDPFIQQGAKIAGVGNFGYSVAMSADGSTALVGARYDTGNVGAAWILTRSGTTWVMGPKLTASDETGAGYFGSSVALSADGSTALIGGEYDASGVGAAWVFTRSSTGVWSQQGSKLTGAGETGSGHFGSSVALSGDGNTAMVGAYEDNSYVGAAWAFTRAGGVWSPQGPKLTASDETGAGRFGSAVVLSPDGNNALIGAPGDTAFGGVWDFSRSGTTWTQGQRLVATGNTDYFNFFGSSIAVSADWSTALIGGPGYENEGAVWWFERSGTTWVQQGAPFTATEAASEGRFGESVQMSSAGTLALVGAPDDNGGVGAAWAFTRTTGVWTQEGPELTGSDENGLGRFGVSVALSGDGRFALTGAPNDDSTRGAVWAFYNPPMRALTVSVAGTGSGTVSGQGISCPGACSNSYQDGATVALTASAATGSTFAGWGGACSGTGGCSVTMTGDQAVTATFRLNAPLNTPLNTGSPAVSGTPTPGHRLTCSTGTWSNGPTRFTYQWHRDGRPVTTAHGNTYAVQVADRAGLLSCVVTAENSAGAGAAAMSASVRVALPGTLTCPKPSGRLRNRTLGPLSLGMTRSRARHKLHRFSARGNVDTFCMFAGWGIRLGYPSSRVLRSLTAGERRRISGRAVLAMTLSPYYGLRGASAGMSVSAVARRLRLGKPIRIRSDSWYFVGGSTSATGVLKARGGTVDEVGTADKRLTRGRAAQLRLLKSLTGI